MKLRYVKTKEDQKAYLRLPKTIYQDDVNYRNLNEYIIKQLFKGKTPFCKDKLILPVIVIDNNEVVAECFYIYTDLLKGQLQVSFFEAKEGFEEAVKLIIEEAKVIAIKNNYKKIVVGLNGHVNYGLGILLDHFDQLPIFGTQYNKPYYAAYFKNYQMNEINLTSFTWDMKLPKLNKYTNLCKRLEESYTLRELDTSNLAHDAKIYTDLNIECFKNHRFYYPSSYDEDLTMLKELLLFTKKEFLIFAYDHDKPIGFVMWYPDFNQILNMGEKLGIKAFIKNKLFAKKITRAKVAEIAVLEEYQGKGVSILLLKHAVKMAGTQYKSGESSWILDDNNASTSLTKAIVDQEYKHYVVFEMDL